MRASKRPNVVAVIPCFRVSAKILDVLSNIPSVVSRIIVIDDKCPEKTGQIVKKSKFGKKVTVITNTTNLGVGGAMKIGYIEAMRTKPDVVIKIDGDGQMNPKIFPNSFPPL